jgi:hypothetical protein
VQGYCRFDTSKADFRSIVAVHGLGGHREKSWTYKNGEERVLWLKDFLPIYVPNARIMTFGYSLEGDGILAAKIADKAAELLGQVSSERIRDNVSARCGISYCRQTCRAQLILSSMLQSRSLIFIGHDVGGTIIKQVLALYPCTAC